MPRPPHLRHDEGGFSLIELLIAMAVTGVLLAALFTFAIAQGHYLATQEQVTQMVQAARAAMDLLTHDVAAAGYNPATVALVGVTYHASQLQLQADVNGNGTADPGEEIIYRYDAGTRRMLRNAGNGDTLLADHIQAFTVVYLDAHGSPTTTSATIRQLRVTLTARTAKPDRQYAANGGYRTYTLTSLMTPRNLAY